MKRFSFLYLFFILFSCDNGQIEELEEATLFDGTETLEVEAETIPDLSDGQIGVLIDGELIIFEGDEVLGENVPQCGMPLLLQVNGEKSYPDGSKLIFNLFVVDAFPGPFDLSIYPWESCFGPSPRVFGVRVSVARIDAAGEFQEVFATVPDLGSVGRVDIQEFEYQNQWADLEDGFVSATFSVLAHETYPSSDSPSSMRLVGAISNVAIVFPGCVSVFC
ncbi:hypothetical protein [Gilvibacter sp.]|uniref:hypothetical protein n=1 Tax=Gilvibacter sp. TaxID=2729997 RepID=UPI0025B9CE0B|nr:hypothetical protein [Gilvibacter sp.]NQX78381.1 hypothetical protein [Gilvibacter sp.]